MNTLAIHDQKILVLGLGISGLAAAELALLYGASVTVLDSGQGERLAERAKKLSNRGAEVILDCNAHVWQAPVDLIVISPGIPPATPLGRLAAGAGCPVVSELEFAYWFCACPIVAVTGTNGKTTTVELVVHCLTGAGLKVVAAGNIGHPFSEAVRRSAFLDYIILEVSSFQLERMDRFAPVAAAILNITEDHLDRYSSFDDYARTKARLLDHVPSPRHVVVREDVYDRFVVTAYPRFRTERPITFSATGHTDRTDYYSDEHATVWRRAKLGVEAVVEGSQLKSRGNHNIENVMAALALCTILRVPLEATAPLIRTFAVNAHRLEPAGARSGVRFVNDSKSTNPDSLIQALITMKNELTEKNGQILLIAGGQNKNMRFESVIPHLQSGVKEVLLMGESKDYLAGLWGGIVPCRKCNSMASIVSAAIENAVAGDIVLLSPGCASLDMFQDYKDRGNKFIAEIQRRQQP